MFQDSRFYVRCEKGKPQKVCDIVFLLEVDTKSLLYVVQKDMKTDLLPDKDLHNT